MAIAAFARFRQNLRETLSHCGSGKDLIDRGFELDVDLAAEYGVSAVAPMLMQEQFVDSSTVRPH